MAFLGYGDNSESNNAVTYGVVLLAEELEEHALAALKEVKAAAGGKDDSRIHCRQLFRPEARAKTAWAHLNEDGAFQLCLSVARSLTEIGMRSQVGFVDNREVAPQVNLPGNAPPIKTIREHLPVYAFRGLAGILDAQVGWDNIRFVLDPDTSRVRWGGRKRQTQEALKGMYSEMRTPGSPRQIQLEFASTPKPLMIDVADVLAYCSAQALSVQVTRVKPRFQEIFAMMAPQVIPGMAPRGPLNWVES